MSHSHAEGSISWTHHRPWWVLTRTFSVATAVHIMAVALLGGLAMTAGWRVAQRILPEQVVLKDKTIAADVEYFGAWPGARIAPTRPLNGSPLFSGLWVATGYPPDDPLRAIPCRTTIPVLRFLDLRLSGYALLYYILGLTWTLLVWSFFGSAICRMASLAFTRDERIELIDGLNFARERFLSCFGAYFLPILAILILAMPIAVLGVVMRLDVGVILGGIFWLFVVSFSFMMILLVFGLILGWPLMWGAVATENTGAFDAVSRAYAYAYQRPVHYFAYVVSAGFLGMLGWLVIWGVSEGLINMGSWAASLGAGRDRLVAIQEMARNPDAKVSLLWVGSELIDWWNILIRTIASTYAYSFFFTAATAIYLILRHDVDGTDMDSVYLEDLSTAVEADAESPRAAASTGRSEEVGGEPNGTPAVPKAPTADPATGSSGA